MPNRSRADTSRRSGSLEARDAAAEVATTVCPLAVVEPGLLTATSFFAAAFAADS